MKLTLTVKRGPDLLMEMEQPVQLVRNSTGYTLGWMAENGSENFRDISYIKAEIQFDARELAGLLRARIR